MTNRHLRLIGFVLLAAMLLCGCDIFRRARRVQAEPPPPFQSPITEVIGRPGMTLPEIVSTLAERRADTRSILGGMSLVVGEARSRTRMQVEADMYFAPPEMLRVRGSSDAGTLFDFLLKDGQVTALLVPERKAHVGTVANLRANTSLLAGIQPDDLMYSFLAEQNLYRMLTAGQLPPQLVEVQGGYEITVAYPTGTTEKYRLRGTDLLIDRIERYQGRRLAGSVRFDGYAFYPSTTGKTTTQHLLPTRFEAQLPNGGVATVIAKTLEPNAPRDEALTIMEIPADYQQLPL